MSDFEFSRRALIYETDIPTEFRRGARTGTEIALRKGDTTGPGTGLVLASSVPQIIPPRPERETKQVQKATIASGVRQLEKLRRSGDRIVQRRIGWQATPDRIVLTTAEREMRKNPEGKYAPASGWLIEDRRTFRMARGRAEKRTGSVPVDPAAAPAGATASSSVPREDAERAVAARFPEGEMSMSVLPTQVRRSMIARVPHPTQFDGVILQTVEPPAVLTVHVLRMDQQRAIVIQATRPLDGDAWDVSQAHYQLTDVEIEAAS